MVVDDQARIREMLGRVLSWEGHTTVMAADGGEALEKLHDQQVDLIVLDLVMPTTNGLQVLTDLQRRESVPPVIVLSAVDDVAARVQALDLGAVDYVGKPFHTAELVARVRRQLATPTPPMASPRYLTAGGIELDLDRRRARVRGDGPELVPLSEREFALLAHLMRRAGRVCSREELLHDV